MSHIHLLSQDVIQSYYNTEVIPLLKSTKVRELYPRFDETTFHKFFYAYTLVSSRAFLVDAFHGLAMVPVADA